MPHSLARIHIHLVFSTKLRAPLIGDDVREALHRYIMAALRNRGCQGDRVNSVQDHIHILFELSRTVTVSEVVEEVKTSPSRWIKSQGAAYAQFAWQRGYAAFAVSRSGVIVVRNYIDRQREHHAIQLFQTEYRLMLERHGLAYDERYVWD